MAFYDGFFAQISGGFDTLAESAENAIFGNDQPTDRTLKTEKTQNLRDSVKTPANATTHIPTAGVKTSSPATISDDGIIGSLFNLGGRYLSSFIDAQQVNDREQTQSEKVNPPQQPNRFKPPTAPAPISFANASGRLVDGVDNKLIYGAIGVAGVVLLVVAIR